MLKLFVLLKYAFGYDAVVADVAVTAAADAVAVMAVVEVVDADADGGNGGRMPLPLFTLFMRASKSVDRVERRRDTADANLIDLYSLRSTLEAMSDACDDDSQ